MIEFFFLVCIVVDINCRFVVLIVISNWFFKILKASLVNGYWEWSNLLIKLSFYYDLYYGGIIVLCLFNY